MIKDRYTEIKDLQRSHTYLDKVMETNYFISNVTKIPIKFLRADNLRSVQDLNKKICDTLYNTKDVKLILYSSISAMLSQ